MNQVKHMLNKRNSKNFMNVCAVLSVSILLILVLCSCSKRPQTDPKYEYIKWEFPDRFVYAISGCSLAPYSEIDIPSLHEGYEVRYILDGAFSHTSIKSLSMTTITEIYAEAFTHCNKLTTLDLGCVETIYRKAFYSCTSLEKVVFPESVKTIEIGAFTQCESLKEVYFKGNPESLSEYIFDQGVIIYGVPGGSVEAYAKQYGFEFRNIMQEDAN